SQWVGVGGAPNTQILAVDAPFKKKVGLGGVLTHDVLGPSSEVSLDGNVSYTIQLDSLGNRLSFGIRAGARLFNVDFSKGLVENPDVAFRRISKASFFPRWEPGSITRVPRGIWDLRCPIS